MRRDIVFVHIAKTGGTSVRCALEQVLADHIILRDYGAVPASTPELNELIGQNRLKHFREEFDRRHKGILLSGHFPHAQSGDAHGASRYWEHFNAESFVTFLRHPLERLYSEFVHFVNLYGWTSGLEQFVSGQPGWHRCRRISLALADVNLRDFGFIGFMEEFNESLAALSRYVGLELPTVRTNVGNYDSLDRDVVNGRYSAMLVDMMQEDIALYDKLRTERSGKYVALHPNGFADGYVGRVRFNGTQASGWLVNRAREFIPEIAVFHNSNLTTTLKADKYRSRPMERGYSRSGICGFGLSLQSIPSLQSGDTVSFRAKGTDYELLGSPLQI